MEKSRLVKICHTVPTAFLSMYQDRQDYTFIEADTLLKDSAYRNYHLRLKEKNPDLYIIMDNSAYIRDEGPLSEKDYMNAYEIIEPNCVIALDHPSDARATIDTTRNFVKNYKAKIDAKIMGVPQGKDYASYHTCAWYLLDDGLVDVIGLNMFMDWPNRGVDGLEKSEKMCRLRIWMMYQMQDMVTEAIRSDKKFRAIHLLGVILGRELNEIVEHNFTHFKSCDTSSAFMHGFHGIRYGKKGLKAKAWDKKIDYSITSLTPKQEKDIEHNMHMLDNLRGA